MKSHETLNGLSERRPVTEISIAAWGTRKSTSNPQRTGQKLSGNIVIDTLKKLELNDRHYGEWRPQRVMKDTIGVIKKLIKRMSFF
jgi:hypothetical protein